eukprot:s4290_g5.t1
MWPPFQELRRSAIRTRAENGATLPVISPVRIDLSLMIFDKTAECCDALRQIFTSKVSIVVFRPFPVLSELLVDFHVLHRIAGKHRRLTGCWATNGHAFSIGTAEPLCVWKLHCARSHWLRQNCFSEHHAAKLLKPVFQAIEGSHYNGIETLQRRLRQIP